MFLLDGNPLRDFDLELVVINSLAVQLDAKLLSERSLKQARDVIGDAHQVDGC